MELPQELAACGRGKARLAAAAGNGGEANGKLQVKQKYLNLATYKYHALGDYVNTVHHYGPTDNYTTQVVHFQLFICSDLIALSFYGELEHRWVERFYA